MPELTVLKFQWEHLTNSDSWICELERYSLMVYCDGKGMWRWVRMTQYEGDTYGQDTFSTWQEAAKSAEDDL